MTSSITLTTQQQLFMPPAFLPASPNKDEQSRLTKFAAWMSDNGHSWVNPNLALYRDYLLQTLADTSTKAHLSTIRKALRRVKNERDYLYSVAAQHAPEGATMAELKPLVDELTVRLDIAIDPDRSKVSVTSKQDKSDNEHVWLTIDQQVTLIKAPDRSTLAGLQDAALISLALATGLRAFELVELRIDDLYHRLGGKDAVLVREGKGNKQRLVPYGAHIGVLQLIHKWINTAGIEHGYIFRGIAKGGRILPNALSVRTFERRLAQYTIDGVTVNPHDLRRTYAQREYNNGMDMVALKNNLGHASIETTQGYIGTLSAEKRMPKQGLQYL